MTMQAANILYFRLFLLLSLMWMATAMPAVGQGSQNPFEIRGQKNTPSQSEEETPTILTNPVESVPVPEITSTNEGVLTESPVVPATSNPLDIQASEATETGLRPSDTRIESVPNSSDNPFELSPSTTKASNRPTSTTSISPPAKKDSKARIKEASKPLSASENTSSFLFILIVLMVLFFTIIVTLFRDFVQKSYQAFANDGQFRNIYREQSSILMSPYSILYVLFLINAGIFVYLILAYYNVGVTKNWQSLLSIIGGLGLIFVSRHLLLTMISKVFPLTKEVELYNFTIVIFNIILGLIFIPINLLLAYGPDNVINPLLYVVFGSIGLLYIYRSIRGLLISGKHFSSHKFHFFMYLCTAEFAPLILLVKYLSKQF